MPAPPAPTAQDWALAVSYTPKNSTRYRYAWGQQVRSMMATALAALALLVSARRGGRGARRARPTVAHMVTAQLDGCSYKASMTFLRFAVTVAALAVPLLALADPPPWAGHGKHGHEQEYWDGNCKVKRKWKHGEWREKRECRGPAPAAVYVPPQPVYVQPAPVYVAPAPVIVQPAPVLVDPGVTIQGTIRLK